MSLSALQCANERIARTTNVVCVCVCLCVKSLIIGYTLIVLKIFEYDLNDFQNIHP